MLTDFFAGKSVFITGHTGFKGAWLSRILTRAGAHVAGFSLPPVSSGAYDALNVNASIDSCVGDIRDFENLYTKFCAAKPSIVFHLAAQPLVIDAFNNPAYTFETNIQGTVNLLECVRKSDSVRSVIIVTTDKVYLENQGLHAYNENDPLGGNEPYSASKACAELVTQAYSNSYLKSNKVSISTVRAGNVIGGGDVSANRIIPDCVRSAKRNETVLIRNRHSIRPFQHVLEPLFAYMLIAKHQYEDNEFTGSYNIGPDADDCITAGEIAEIFCDEWGSNQKWMTKNNTHFPHEAEFLKLDSSKIKAHFKWKPVWNVRDAVRKTVEWEKSEDRIAITDRQIDEYEKLFN